MIQYFPKPYEPSGGDINVKVDLSNYPTKKDLKKATRTDTSNLATKSDLASLKAETDVGKLKTASIDLSELGNVVRMKLLKKLCMINWLQKLIILILVDLF